MGETLSFGAWLKRRRKALDLTQADLARRAGCSVVTIRKLEAEVQPPSRQLAELLAQHLAIPPQERATFIRIRAAGPGCSAAGAAHRSQPGAGWRLFRPAAQWT